jgi:hypothetical protein
VTPDEEKLEATTRQAIVGVLQTAIADRFGGMVRGKAMDRCESIFERVFFLWWVGLLISESFTDRAWHEDWSFPCSTPMAQQEIQCGGNQTFRADFTIGRCVIEIDGHAFHERTPEQVVARNRRDEYLQRAGWSVLHCSSHELLKTPRVAVMRIARAVSEIESLRLRSQQ